jgi:hypothetical protein
MHIVLLVGILCASGWAAPPEDSPTHIVRRCIGLFERIQKSAAGTFRYRGIGPVQVVDSGATRRDGWTDADIRETFIDGIYAPIIYTLARQHNVLPRQVYQHFKHLEEAPKELVWLIASKEKWMWGSDRKMISTSSSSAVPFRFMDKYGTQGERNVRFKLRIPIEKQVFSVSFNAKDYAKTILLALKHTKDELAVLAMGAQPYLQERFSRAGAIRDWFEKNAWGRQFFHDANDPTPERMRIIWAGRAEQERSAIEPILEVLPFVGEGEYTVLLHIPGSAIEAVDVYDHRRKYVKTLRPPQN